MSTLFSILGLRAVISVFIALAPIALLIVLQVWLCKKEGRLGLILPALSLLLALLVTAAIPLSMRAFSGTEGTLTMERDGVVVREEVHRGGTVTVYDGEGNVLDEYPDPDYHPGEARADMVRMVCVTAVVFLITNIPTVIFGGIWLHYKGRRDAREDLRRMRIADLE